MPLLNHYSREEPKLPTYKKRHILSVYIFGAILTARRIRVGMTQERLSRRAKCSVRTIQRIEKGDGWVLVSTARALARAFRIELNELLIAPHGITDATDPRLERMFKNQI
jgi:transcriptional regulator with XRE-family HTH domain